MNQLYHRFRINIPKSRNHILVKICKDKAEFDKHLIAFGIEKPNGYGICIGLKHEDYKNGNKGKSSDACMIFMIEDQCGAGYVAHEFTHAVLYLARHEIKRLLLTDKFWTKDSATEQEERICDVMGWLQNRFWNRWNKYYKEKRK